MVVNNRYKIVKECGCGNFSKVYESVDLKDNSRVAIKFLKKEYAADASFERDILKGLNDKDKSNTAKVAKMTDYFVYNRFPTFVFPLKGPSLRACKLGVTRGNVPKDEMREFAKEMLTTLKFLHKEVKMVHTDIKPENILLDKTLPTGQVGIGQSWSLCDFGSASFLRPDRLDSDLISTRPYRAPEVVMGQGWSTSADIWSMACVFFEVQAGSRCFEIHDDNDHLHAFVSRLGAKVPTFFSRSAKNSSKFFGQDGSFRRPSTKSIRSMAEVLKETPEFLDLLKSMMDYDPKRRPTAEEALQHPFFASCRSRKSSSAEAVSAGVENKKAPSPPTKKAPSPPNTAAPSSTTSATGAAFPNVLQERAAKVDNQMVDVRVKKTEVRSGAASAALPQVAAGTPSTSSGRFVAPNNTVQAAMQMAKLKAGEMQAPIRGALPAAGRPSYSARASLGSGRYY